MGARDPQRIFARGRLAPRAVIDGKTARGAAFGIDVVIIAAEALAIEIHRRRHAQIGALRQRAAVIDRRRRGPAAVAARNILRSEEHTSELQSLMRISYAVFCL